jgi:hypothetical protein
MIVCFVDIGGIVEVRAPISTKQTIISHLNNSININKINNHLSPQQFHQYQQNKQSPLTSTIPPKIVEVRGDYLFVYNYLR